MADQEVQAAAQSAMQPAQVTAEQLQQMVAPIAMYPDELVAQVLAAATYPTEVVEANRWLQQNPSLKNAQLAGEMDKQSWDPRVKALTQFPSVVANMDKNLSWTSAVGAKPWRSDLPPAPTRGSMYNHVDGAFSGAHSRTARSTSSESRTLM